MAQAPRWDFFVTPGARPLRYKPGVARFFAGFVVASVIWAGLGFAHVRGYIDLGLDEEEVEVLPVEGSDAGVVEEETDPRNKRRRKRKASAGGTGSVRRGPGGEVLTGDDLREDEARNIDVEGGGEEQLTGSEIEAGFDSVFGKVRRCLLLVADDEPVTGKVIFGMRVAGSGQVTAVNLKGPSGITASEAGDCMRTAAKSIRFRSFNGPEMLVHYPLTLE